MTDQLISFETAKLAEEKGFNIPCPLYFRENGSTTTETAMKTSLEGIDYYAQPTQSLLQKWLREVHDIHVYVNYYSFAVRESNGYYYHFGKSVRNVQLMYYGKYNTYEEALEIGLQGALKLIKTMKREELYKKGDLVIHKSNPDIIWVVCAINGFGNYICTNVNKKGEASNATFIEEEITFKI